MRKLALLFLALIVVISACQEQEGVSPVTADDATVTLQDQRGTRAIPNGDPNLNPSFNWDTFSYPSSFANASIRFTFSLYQGWL